MVAADIIPDDVTKKTVRDMIAIVCADALYEIRHNLDAETVRALIWENDCKMRADEQMSDLNIIRLALTNKMYMEYMSRLNVDADVHLYRDDYESDSDEDEYESDGETGGDEEEE